MICQSRYGVTSAAAARPIASFQGLYPVSIVSRRRCLRSDRSATPLSPRPCSRSAPAPCRRTVIVARAAHAQSTGTLLPLNYYTILQVNSAASKDTLSRAFSRLNKADSEYSGETLEARTQLLKAALETLMDGAKRRLYDNAIVTGSYELELDADQLPAALSLLEEAGDIATVLRWGPTVLQGGLGGSRALQKDLALAVANAHCAAAEQTYTSDDIATYESMDAALTLLQRYKVAGKLQKDISSTLEEVAARAALTLLALPLVPEHGGRRARGLDMLLATLAGQASEWTADERNAYLEAARPHMTAAEQIRLWEAQPSGTLTEIQDAALAHLAEGVRACRVGAVRTADRLLARLQAAAATADAEQLEPFDGVVDVSTERAVCRLLLGDMEGAEAALGLTAGSNVAAATNPEILDFVQAESGGGDDLLPGICALAHRFLVDVQLPAFRCCRGIRVPLTYWFDNRNVAIQLQLSDVWGLLRLSSLLRLLRSGAGAIGNAASAVISKPLGVAQASAASLSSKLGGGGQHGSDAAAISGSNGSDPVPALAGQGVQRLSGSDTIALIEGAYQRQAQLQAPGSDPVPSQQSPAALAPEPSRQQSSPAAAARPGPSAVSASTAPPQPPPAAPPQFQPAAQHAVPVRPPPQQQQPSLRESPPQVSPAQQRFLEGGVGRSAAVLERDVQPAFPDSAEADEWGDTADGAADAGGSGVIGGSNSDAGSLIDGTDADGLEYLELEGEREMWAPLTTRRQRRTRSLVGLGALAVLALAAWRILLPPRTSAPPPPPSEPLTTVTTDVGHPIRGGPVRAVRRLVGHGLFAKPAAHKLVTKWEAAKAAAMGRRHQVGRLDAVLTGPMLGHWQGQARAVKAAGSYVEYDLQEVTIEELEVSRAVNEARIVATIDETRSWVDAKTGQVLQVEGGRSRVAYRALRTEGTWKLQASEALDRN